MTADDLKSLLSGPQPPNLINVLPPEVFAIRHIPGSLNACVYEITFGDKVRTLAPDLSREIVVYGAGEGGLEAKVAGDRLTESGYQNVRVFDGGMKEWLSARLPIEGNHDTPAKHIEGIYVLDNKASQIRWTGRNLFNHHHGFLLLANGRMEMRNEKLIDASFEIDMRSIVC